MAGPTYYARSHRGGWSWLDYLLFLASALGGLLFVVIPVHELTHYGIATMLGFNATMRIGLGWGYVVAPGATHLAALMIGSAPMLLEGFTAAMLLRRGSSTTSPLAVGFGLAFAFNLFNSVANVGQSDFWALWAMGYGQITSFGTLVATALGAGIGAPRVVIRPTPT